MNLGSNSDLKVTLLHVKWKVTPVSGISSYNDTSSHFRFLDNNTRHLEFQLLRGSCHLSLHSVNSSFFDVVAEQLVVTVHVKSRTTGQVLPALTSTTRIHDGVSQIFIWERTTEALLQASVEFKTNLRLEFILLFDVAGENSTSALLHSVPAVQSTSNASCLESLSDDLSKLLDQGSNPDVEFLCGGQSTKAHGAVVSARSGVIAKMLASDMIEGNTRLLKIPDMEPDIFRKFLRYLYTGKLDELSFEVALSLFEAGDQYAVSGLVKICSSYLMGHLSAQNACGVLVIADAHSDEDLVEKVVNYMVDQRVPSSSEVWPAFCDEHPKLANMVLNRGWKVLVK